MLARLRHEPPTWLLVLAIIFFIAVLSTSLLAWIFESNYKDKVYPGVFIGKLNVGGLTDQQLRDKLNNRVDDINKKGVAFVFQDKRATLSMVSVSSDGDFVQKVIDFDADKMRDQAMAYGRDNNPFINISHQITALLATARIEPSYVINDGEVASFLQSNFKNGLASSENAQLAFVNGNFVIQPERTGTGLDAAAALAELDASMADLDQHDIALKLTEEQPKIKAADLQNFLSQANDYLELAPLRLTYKQKSWSVDRSELGKWLAIRSDADGQPAIGLNASNTERFLTAKVNPDVEIKMIDARFIMTNGKAVAFSTARDGLTVNATATLAKIEQTFIGAKEREIEIEMQKIQSSVSSTTDANNLGIKEIIGTGQSNFVGSPKNRRTNIRVGMSYLNGLLIAPGETFSVMRHLGHIDESKGYLEELVIKGNETKKEFGGGLCQIGTTMFRAALASGLPIVERRNHSYRVAYYEPAGTDATIYDPSPDLKFTNDTGNYILIQGRISGNNLYFDFWGTKDGRKAERSYPTIYNIVKPPPAKEIETLSLPVGQKKCTEHAHNGADAWFNYKVTYADGTIKTKKFSSHYVPWQEVCLIGVSKLSATSTQAVRPASKSSSTPATTSPSSKLNTSSASQTATSSLAQ